MHDIGMFGHVTYQRIFLSDLNKKPFYESCFKNDVTFIMTYLTAGYQT